MIELAAAFDLALRAGLSLAAVVFVCAVCALVAIGAGVLLSGRLR